MSGIIRLGGRRGRRRDLGDFVDSSGNWVSSASDSSGSLDLAPMNPSAYAPTSSPFYLTPTEAQLASQAINVAGQIGVKAVSPTPTLTYTPYGITATGGAQIPTSLPTSSIFGSSALSTLTSPTVLLLGAGVLLVAMFAGKR